MKRIPTTTPDLERALEGVPDREAEALRAAWETALEAEPNFSPQMAGTEEAWTRLEGALDASEAVDTPGVPNRGPRRFLRNVPVQRTWIAYAAAAAVVIAVAGGINWRNGAVEHVAPGSRLTVELPDGSSVELNAGSRLRHARRFGAERRVQLDGEAFFDVERGQRRFVVKTFNADVAVLGTTFNVRAWPADEGARTTVALVTGSVALTPAGNPAGTVTMAPGDTRMVMAHGTEAPAQAAVSTNEATAWRQGDFFFKDEFVGAILADVERRFGASVVLMDSDHARRRLSVALRNPEAPEAVLRDLAPALGLAYRETASGFELYAPRP